MTDERESGPEARRRPLVGWYTEAAADSLVAGRVETACPTGTGLTRLGSPASVRGYAPAAADIQRRGITCVLLDVSASFHQARNIYDDMGANAFAHRLMLDLAVDAILPGEEYHTDVRERRRRNGLPVCKFVEHPADSDAWQEGLAVLLRDGTPYYWEGLAGDLEKQVRIRQDILDRHLAALRHRR